MIPQGMPKVQPAVIAKLPGTCYNYTQYSREGGITMDKEPRLTQLTPAAG